MKPVLTEDLAELIGIVFGDGYINHYPDYHYRIEISGHSVTDYKYHCTYISSLFQILFGIRPRIRVRKDQQTIVTRLDSKRVFSLLSDAGVPHGRKKYLSIPNWILEDKRYLIAFLRGIFDTDGSIIIRTRGQHSISLGLKNQELILQIKNLLEQMGYFVSYHYSRQKDKRGFESESHCIRINQKELIKRFSHEIGFSNPYKKQRIEKMAESGNAGI